MPCLCLGLSVRFSKGMLCVRDGSSGMRNGLGYEANSRE